MSWLIDPQAETILKRLIEKHARGNPSNGNFQAGHHGPKVVAKECRVCSTAGVKRCDHCRVVFYCGQKCQTEDWPNHKASCKKSQKSQKRLAIVDDGKVPATMLYVHDYNKKAKENRLRGSTASIHANSAASSLFATYDRERREKGEMILKIQAPMDGPKVHLLAYNEDRRWIALSGGWNQKVILKCIEKLKTNFLIMVRQMCK